MPRVLVTGAAGFIGSHLCDRLLAQGHAVVGIDNFSEYYDPTAKRENLTAALQDTGFELLEIDLSQDGLDSLGEFELVFHLAAQAGVRSSWGTEFESYARDNVIATQRLLEALRDCPPARFVYGSSSSIYGDAEALPTGEEEIPRPFSPYGVTKLAAEHLVRLYQRNFDLPALAVRFFTVYGPRQRPDMGIHRFVEAVLGERPIEVYGDGSQSRDFTYVADTIDCLLLAGERGRPGRVYNCGGGRSYSLNDILDAITVVTGIKPDLQFGDRLPGDVDRTLADTTRARSELGFEARISLQDGIASQVDWHRQRRARARGAA